MNAKVVPDMNGALGVVTPKLEERLQQMPGTASELCPEERGGRNSSGTAQKPQTPRPLVEDPRLKKTHIPPTGDLERELGFFFIYISTTVGGGSGPVCCLQTPEEVGGHT